MQHETLKTRHHFQFSWPIHTLFYALAFILVLNLAGVLEVFKNGVAKTENDSTAQFHSDISRYRDKQQGKVLDDTSYLDLDDSVVPPEEGAAMSKLNFFWNCLSHCEVQDTKPSFQLNKRDLEKHYNDIIRITSTMRPIKRSKAAIYREFSGPRLEDHFIQGLIDNDFITSFYPVVPLFVHWTEMMYGIKRKTRFRELEKLKNALRKDVLYFSVTSMKITAFYEKELSEFSIVYASSKGQNKAHIILPHLFQENSPAFTLKGIPLLRQKKAKYEPRDIPSLFSFEENTKVAWNFKNYEKFLFNGGDKMTSKQRETFNSLMEETWLSFNGTLAEDVKDKKFPPQYKVSFIGNLKSNHKRFIMDEALREAFGEDYYLGFFHQIEKCMDYSVTTNISPCWRVFMLSSDFTMSPIGTAPVSYRLYESMQMGMIPIYLYDNRGAFIPYYNTSADVRNLGLVENLHKMDSVVEWIKSKTQDEILNMRVEVMRLRDSHFSALGVVGQIKKLLQLPGENGESDLRCCVSPVYDD